MEVEYDVDLNRVFGEELVWVLVLVVLPPLRLDGG